MGKKKIILREHKDKPVGLTREVIGSQVYMANIILNYPDHIGNIDTQTVYSDKGLDIWVDFCKGKVTGVQVIYNWGMDAKQAKKYIRNL